MDMNGTQRIEAPRDVVYTALNDVDVLKQSIPGCETIEKVSDNQRQATITRKVGPVKASFKGMVTLSDLDPPNGYTNTGEGSGGAAGFAKGGAKVSLEPDGAATILSYTVNADIGGKLAQLGGRLIDGTAKKLAAEFFDKFGSIVSKSQEPPEAPLSEEAAVSSKKEGWFNKVFGSTAALLLGFGVYTHGCCLGWPGSAANASFHAPICSALGHIGAPQT